MPKIVDHDQQRRELLLRSFDLFRRRGYDNVTLREIAREIGASTGTLYHYFPSKLAILEQLYVLAVRDELGSVDGASAKGIDGREKLRRLSAMWQRSGNLHQGLLLLALDLFRNGGPQSAQVLTNYAAGYKQAIGASLGLGEEVADAVFTWLLGANLHALLTPGSYSFPERVRRLEGVLAELLAAPDSRRPLPATVRRAKVRPGVQKARKKKPAPRAGKARRK
jgi:AcrR family transcriptional regulator